MNATNTTSPVAPSTVTETEKISKNPHEVSLGKFLRARAVPVSYGYAMLSNGQIIKANRGLNG